MHLIAAADAVSHLKANGTHIFHTQVMRAAKKGGKAKGWLFLFEEPQANQCPSLVAPGSNIAHTLVSSSSALSLPSPHAPV